MFAWRGTAAAVVPAALLLCCALAAAPAARAEAPCYYESHFVVKDADNCTPSCKAKLNPTTHTVSPEVYAVDSKLCCKCQFESKVASPSPSPSPKPSPSPPAASAKAQAQAQAKAAEAAKRGWWKKHWWQVLIAIGCLILVLLGGVAALVWDCINCRHRRATKEEIKEEAQVEKAKRGSTREHMSREAQRKLAALDLAREMRDTKLEAQQPARFDIVVAASSSSAPSSPARSRFQKLRSSMNPFAAK